MSQINDTPNYHGMFMLGEKTLFLSHMPMFTKECHMYQMIIEASLPEDVMSAYVSDRKANPSLVYNLINSEGSPFTLPSVAIGEVTEYPVDIYQDYSNEGEGGPVGQPINKNVTLKVERVVVYRHFDFNFNYPSNLTYILFGKGDEAHLSHYISKDPDFQQLLSLDSAPTWLDQDELQAGITVNFMGKSSTPVPCQNPLPAGNYEVMYQGQLYNTQNLEIGSDSSFWFSTGNLLNSENPCADLCTI